METESKVGVTSGWGDWKRECILIGIEFQCGKMKKLYRAVFQQ